MSWKTVSRVLRRNVSIELTVDEGVRNSDVDYTDGQLSMATISLSELKPICRIQAYRCPLPR